MKPLMKNLTAHVYDGFGDLVGARLFVALCGHLPSEEYHASLDVAKAREVLRSHVKAPDLFEVERKRFEQMNDQSRDEKDMGSALVFAPNLMVIFKTNNRTFEDGVGGAHLLYSGTTDQKLLKTVRQVLKESMIAGNNQQKYIHLVSNHQGDLDTTRFKVDIKPVDLPVYFNDSLLEVDPVIQKGLVQAGGKALILLHGEPGTGKTTYIRHLVASVDKPFIYLPPSMTHHIADPAFVSLLSDHKDSVLVVEDADNALMTRNGQNNSAVSNLLNLTDGLLADCFNLKVICTINTHVSRIDPALLRKGRLLMQYQFQPLEPLKVESLLESLGREPHARRAMTLAEIFNTEDTGQGTVHTPMGFAVGAER